MTAGVIRILTTSWGEVTIVTVECDQCSHKCSAVSSGHHDHPGHPSAAPGGLCRPCLRHHGLYIANIMWVDTLIWSEVRVTGLCLEAAWWPPWSSPSRCQTTWRTSRRPSQSPWTPPARMSLSRGTAPPRTRNQRYE